MFFQFGRWPLETWNFLEDIFLLVIDKRHNKSIGLGEMLTTISAILSLFIPFVGCHFFLHFQHIIHHLCNKGERKGQMGGQSQTLIGGNKQ
ncbi:hypothetical protein Mgra_00003688 [Meloidogyne graminicola]|uniref:Uncharacterized protein n=1 Tax=Meloidogyne graminicola TaxID=189291 RepID=A0A8S9ZUS0_9BILA|nr:hypothetical protein Mgra_00003688 [Meloidogyne graminicola]